MPGCSEDLLHQKLQVGNSFMRLFCVKLLLFGDIILPKQSEVYLTYSLLCLATEEGTEILLFMTKEGFEAVY